MYIYGFVLLLVWIDFVKAGDLLEDFLGPGTADIIQVNERPTNSPVGVNDEGRGERKLAAPADSISQRETQPELSMKAYQFFRQLAGDPVPPGDTVAHVAQQRKLQAVCFPGQQRSIRQLRGNREQPHSRCLQARQNELKPAKIGRAKRTPAATKEDKDNRTQFQFAIKANLPAARVREDEIGSLLPRAAHPVRHGVMRNTGDKRIEHPQRLRRNLHF